MKSNGIELDFDHERTVQLVLYLGQIEHSLGAQGHVKPSASDHGLHGEIEFTQKNDTAITVRTNFNATLQYPEQVWAWAVHEFPVDYRELSDSRCSEINLGKQVIDFTKEVGYLIIPDSERAEFDSENAMTGLNGLWGKSIVFREVERDRTLCATILSVDEPEKSAVAKFSAPIAGNVHFRWLTTKEGNETDSYITTDLYHVKGAKEKMDLSQHSWKLFVTDIFDVDRGTYEDRCDVLQQVFDPENRGDGSALGDLDSRLGPVKIASDANVKKVKTLYRNDVINALRRDMDATTRDLYVVIYDNRREDSFLACARLRMLPPKVVKALINMGGVKGEVEFTQRSPFEPTWSDFHLGASDNNYASNVIFVDSVLAYSIKELPPRLLDESQVNSYCNTTGNIYNPTHIDLKNVPPAGMGTQDQYAIGDLLGKYKKRTEYLDHRYLLPGLADELSGAYWDVFLPLHGVSSVVQRALVLDRKASKHSLCATILPYEHDTGYQTQMSSAQVIFRYPLVGRVVLRQPVDRPWEDTIVIIESMIHADGANVNNTFEHRWAIHENAPGADYYNWSQRCLSAGKVYEPYHLDLKDKPADQYCRPGLEGYCRIGDLTTRHGTLAVAGRKRDSFKLTRRLFTDTVMSLSGRQSVMKKSLVIFDDHGPAARGERMACSIVNGLHRRKAVVRDWFGNGEPVDFKGKLELIQQSEYDLTNAQVQFDGLTNVHNYKIHETPVEKDLEFPCEKTTLYDAYNPFHVNGARTPPPTLGTADQYELGDLGNKYGLLENKKSLSTYFNETQVSLFGPFSILGRSVVLHQKTKDRRWACSSVERGYSPSEAREIRGIASFHHPNGFAYGYVRMTQLIHYDGSQSDTVVEVKLRYPGVNDRGDRGYSFALASSWLLKVCTVQRMKFTPLIWLRMIRCGGITLLDPSFSPVLLFYAIATLTHNHDWAVFVNPVSVDATVKVTNTRCVAGGYRWNPYFTQLADPLNHDLYNQECGADNPLRCDVGDLSARLGTISIGGKRQMFMDSNLPLEGTVNVMGRSVVIMGPNRSPERFACANIEPDKDIIKYANVMKSPRFVLTQFLEDVRRVMGVPEWMISVDSRQTKTLHQGACIQILLHFTGPHANRLELDFTRLLASGRLDEPSIHIPSYVDTKRKKTVSYKNCGVTDPTEKGRKPYFFIRNVQGFVGIRSTGPVMTTCVRVCVHVLMAPPLVLPAGETQPRAPRRCRGNGPEVEWGPRAAKGLTISFICLDSSGLLHFFF
ncbi:hypothetical protein EVAR_19831_1 [Eumeta japonica]|uniref:Superoxide dismutase copper/zinc binding domain-containing protein n=1 Tax=Eumeta variegata TaxID=151549 RepID=A0A4C1URZ5_EUMVA|nr:hypothetical protein EVAR_19831_1 [Eumeta japonica]